MIQWTFRASWPWRRKVGTRNEHTLTHTPLPFPFARSRDVLITHLFSTAISVAKSCVALSIPIPSLVVSPCGISLISLHVSRLSLFPHPSHNSTPSTTTIHTRSSHPRPSDDANSVADAPHIQPKPAQHCHPLPVPWFCPSTSYQKRRRRSRHPSLCVHGCTSESSHFACHLRFISSAVSRLLVKKESDTSHEACFLPARPLLGRLGFSCHRCPSCPRLGPNSRRRRRR